MEKKLRGAHCLETTSRNSRHKPFKAPDNMVRGRWRSIMSFSYLHGTFLAQDYSRFTCCAFHRPTLPQDRDGVLFNRAKERLARMRLVRVPITSNATTTPYATIVMMRQNHSFLRNRIRGLMSSLPKLGSSLWAPAIQAISSHPLCDLEICESMLAETFNYCRLHG